MAHWLIYLTILSAAVTLQSSAHAVVVSSSTLASNDLVITEYLANPVGVADNQAEYFEVYNTTANSIDLTDLVVRDDGSNSFTIAAGEVAPFSFAVFGASDGSSLGHAVDIVYGSAMSLTNTDDEIGLYRPDGALVHKLLYDDGDNFGAGIAHEIVAVGAATPATVFGPSAGSDFFAATNPLALENFGSPGMAGNSLIATAAVPLPAGIWMFSAALSMLAWARRRAMRPGQTVDNVAGWSSPRGNGQTAPTRIVTAREIIDPGMAATR